MTAVLVMAGLSACNSEPDVVVTKPPANGNGSPATTGGYSGLVREPAIDKPNIQLVDTKGKAFDLRRDTAGQPTLMYFGYTRCPDECPTTLHDLHAALRLVPEDLRKKIKVYFVTTDPKRDTPVVLAKYLQQFDSTFIGLTGTDKQIIDAEASLSLPPSAADTAAPLPNGAGYSVQHATVVVAFDTANRNPVLYPGGTTVETYAADFPLLAKEPS